MAAQMLLGRAGRMITLGIIGLGARCQEELGDILAMKDVTVSAVCDVVPERVASTCARVEKEHGTLPYGTDDPNAILSDDKIEAVLILTGWEKHVEIACNAMRAGKAVALEVGGAQSLDECWKLVHTQEETKAPFMLMENCCYGRNEMTLLKAIREGIFGEVVHCEGGYEHDLRDEIGLGDKNIHYRLQHFIHRNGELYPTHELGPIAKYLDLGNGNRMLTLCSMASKAVGMTDWLQKNRPEDEVSRIPFAQGDVVTTMIKCARGESILLKHVCSLPRPYSRGGVVEGTRGIWMEDNHSVYLDSFEQKHKWVKDDEFLSEHLHPLWREYEEFGKRGGHGGMDYLVLRAFFESVQDGKPCPIDVYDAAAWMAITTLSEESIAKGGMPVSVPDFSNGRWMYHKQPDTGLFAL